MDIFEKIAENKILSAQRQGQFDNLPGQGKPLQLEDDNHIPAPFRMAYRILKNAGYVPPEIELLREINQLSDLIEMENDEGARLQGHKKLALLRLRLGTMRGQGIDFSAERQYRRTICRHLTPDVI